MDGGSYVFMASSIAATLLGMHANAVTGDNSRGHNLIGVGVLWGLVLAINIFIKQTGN